MKLKRNFVLILSAILILFMIILAASIIQDILIIIFKDSLNKSIFVIIHATLLYIFIILGSKTKAIKNFEEEIKTQFKKK